MKRVRIFFPSGQYFQIDKLTEDKIKDLTNWWLHSGWGNYELENGKTTFYINREGISAITVSKIEEPVVIEPEKKKRWFNL